MRNTSVYSVINTFLSLIYSNLCYLLKVLVATKKIYSIELILHLLAYISGKFFVINPNVTYPA